MKDLADILTALVGRTIVGSGTDDDELVLELDDGHIIWIWCEEDELFLTIDNDGVQEKH
jgi:hypothetical protein